MFASNYPERRKKHFIDCHHPRCADILSVSRLSLFTKILFLFLHSVIYSSVSRKSSINQSFNSFSMSSIIPLIISLHVAFHSLNNLSGTVTFHDLLKYFSLRPARERGSVGSCSNQRGSEATCGREFLCLSNQVSKHSSPLAQRESRVPMTSRLQCIRNNGSDLFQRMM